MTAAYADRLEREPHYPWGPLAALVDKLIEDVEYGIAAAEFEDYAAGVLLVLARKDAAWRARSRSNPGPWIGLRRGASLPRWL